MRRLTRRDVVKEAAAGALFAPALLLTGKARAQLPTLPNLPSSDALLLHPGDPQFAQYQTSFNERTALTPQLRALCRNARAVGTVIDWCRSNNLAFRCAAAGIRMRGFPKVRAS